MNRSTAAASAVVGAPEAVFDVQLHQVDPAGTCAGPAGERTPRGLLVYTF